MRTLIALDALIYGGGITGLWLLDALSRRGYAAVLIERDALGGGQTACSQGILHSGLKYSLAGALSESARRVRDMPQTWRDCLAGAHEPVLSRDCIRAESCHIWRTDALASRLGMLGARLGLRATPQIIDDAERPELLRRAPGSVARLDELVIDPLVVVRDLSAGWIDRILRCDAHEHHRIHTDGMDVRASIISNGRLLELRADCAILCAGEGNAALREELSLSAAAQQVRPLHMVMVRGRLPQLFGHCVDGNRTRITITSAADSAGRTVWHIGGQVAEDGATMQRDALIEHAAREVCESLNGYDVGRVEWSTYRINRAEGRAPGGSRPDDACILVDGRIITAWPTKFVLAPRVAERIVEMLEPPEGKNVPLEELSHWPRPELAQPPWEIETEWTAAPSAARV